MYIWIGNVSRAICLATLLSLLFGAADVRADDWKFFGSAKVRSIAQWQDSSPVYIELAPDTWCYVPAAEKNLIALIISLHATGRSADFHCHAAPESFGGMTGYRLHRIIAR